VGQYLKDAPSELEPFAFVQAGFGWGFLFGVLLFFYLVYAATGACLAAIQPRSGGI
jgi:hypothetical protein